MSSARSDGGAARPAWIETDLGAIRRNVERIRARLSPGTGYLAVVKANAYGHGDVPVARAAIEAGASWLGVALVDEGIRLREAGTDTPVLLLHEPPPERADDVLAHDLTPSVFTEAGVAALGAAAERAGRATGVHLKVDTGLNRLGCPPWMLDSLAAALGKEPRLDVEAVFSHFAFADDPGNPFIGEQMRRFDDACARLEQLGVRPRVRHLANSAATLTRRDAHLDLVRVGIATYGLAPGPGLAGIVELEPALSLHARVAMVKRVPAGEGISYGLRYRLRRPSTVATIPLGYADGWSRALSGKAQVLIGGRRYPAVGTVCMDSFVVDLGEDGCDVGDEAVLIGRQGAERIGAEELAEAIGTINYEIVAGLSARLPRIAHG
ncbi:MAG: alanine racemase [Acidobacteria bacterium]|nr:alanine racemase [Acidobacteriota bacterium]